MALTDETLPGLFQAADQASLTGQRRYLAASRLRLGLAVAAAIAGAASLHLGASGFDAAAAAAAVALVAAAFVETWLLAEKPEQTWYDGRALAESAKTIAWRYAMGAAPFAKDVDETAAGRLLIDQLGSLLQDAPPTSIEPNANPAITEGMRRLRRRNLEERKLIYINGRISDQQRWYTDKARWNGKRALLWRTGLIAAELVGSRQLYSAHLV